MSWAEATLDALPQAVVTLKPRYDMHGAIVDFEYVWANASACTYNGLSRVDTVGRSLLELFPGAAKELLGHYAEVMQTGRSLLLPDAVYDNERRGHEPLRYDIWAARSGDVLVLSWHEVTERYVAARDLRQQASTDYLTQLTSRQEGLALLRRALTHHADGPALGIAYLDVDGLKLVNDRHGHAAGDALLVAVALRVRSCVRPDDVVIRMGGDEMVVILHGVGDLEAASAVCEKLRAQVSAPLTVNEEPVTTSLSIGLTMARVGDTSATVLERADAAMYLSKQAGGDRVTVR